MTTILQAIEFVKHAAATKDVGFYLNGVHVKQADRKLRFTATDGQLAARITIPVESEAEFDLIITNDGVKLAIAQLKAGVNVDWGTLPAHKTSDPEQPLKYPDVDRVMPTKMVATATVRMNGEYLAKACAAAAKISDMRHIDILLHGDNRIIKGELVGVDAWFLIMPIWT